MIISFTIPGQPVPYLRMTQAQVKLMRIPYHRLSPSGQKKVDQIRKYLTWKDLAFLCSEKWGIDRAPKSKIYMDIKIYHASRVHGDGDNIWKGCADAIFKNDKMVAGSFDFWYDSENPRVEVTIHG